MNRQPKPGQFCSVNGVVLRARKRVNGCRGCVYYNDIIMCPEIVDSRNGKRRYNCVLNNVIFTRK